MHEASAVESFGIAMKSRKPTPALTQNDGDAQSTNQLHWKTPKARALAD